MSGRHSSAWVKIARGMILTFGTTYNVAKEEIAVCSFQIRYQVSITSLEKLKQDSSENF